MTSHGSVRRERQRSRPQGLARDGEELSFVTNCLRPHCEGSLRAGDCKVVGAGWTASVCVVIRGLGLYVCVCMGAAATLCEVWASSGAVRVMRQCMAPSLLCEVPARRRGGASTKGAARRSQPAGHTPTCQAVWGRAFHTVFHVFVISGSCVQGVVAVGSMADVMGGQAPSMAIPLLSAGPQTDTWAV